MPNGQKRTPAEAVLGLQVSAWFKDLLRERNWTPADFNEAMGWTRNSTRLYPYLKGAVPSQARIAEIETKLGVKPPSPEEILQPRTRPVAVPVTNGARPVLTHTISSDGTASLRLELTLPAEQSLRVLQLLAEQGLLITDHGPSC